MRTGRTLPSCALASGALAAGIGGCGFSTPGVPPSRPVKRTQMAVAQATHEYPGPAARPQRVIRGFASPVAAIVAFAGAYINWTAGTVAAQLRHLAQSSVGQARSAVALAAAQTGGDYELARDGIANSGQIEAIAPLGRHRRQYVVVTRELTTATATSAYQGLQPAWHVTVATVTEPSPGEWVVTGWQPES